MEKYIIKRVTYVNEKNRYCVIKLNNIGAYAGYWDVCLGKNDLSLKESETHLFQLETIDNKVLRENAKIQWNTIGGYTLIGNQLFIDYTHR